MGADGIVRTDLTIEMGVRKRGQSLAMARLYSRVYKFRPLSMDVTALCLVTAEALLIGVLGYKGCEPLCQRGGVAYIEYVDPSQSSVTQGFNERIKVRTLLITPVFNDLYDNRVNV